ncbi:hypothetical protein DSECCO2_478070 [anaerobic digester metagenome]
MQACKFVGELLLARLELHDQAALILDLLLRCGDLAVDLLILRLQAAPFRGKFLDTVCKVLPLAFGVGDVGVLVPEPSLDILHRLADALVPLGEHGNLGVVEFLLEVVDLRRYLRDLAGYPLEIGLEPREFLAAGLCGIEHLAQVLLERPFLAGKHLDALLELVHQHAVARNLLVD